MRNVVMLAALACGTVLPLDAASWLEETPPQDIQLDSLLRQPDPYLNLRVRFKAVFVENGDLYDPIHTQYSPETYINLVVWDDDARIWDPQVRAKPYASLYLSKDRLTKTALRDLHKYDVVEITGEVASTFRKQPWVTIQQITPVEGEGRFSDNAVYHLEQAAAMANDGARDLAETQYAAAMSEKLPITNEIIVEGLRAKNLAASGHDAEAAKLLERAAKQAKPEDGDSPVSAKDRADIEYMLARVKDDLAANELGDQARKDLYLAAAKHARTAIELDPTLSDAYSALGIADAGLGEFDEARKQCAIAIRMQPNNAETRLYLGRILDQQGQQDEAIEALKKAIDLTPKDARMHAAIAGAYEHRGGKAGAAGGNDLTTALREFDIAIRLKPNDADLINSSGRVIEEAAQAKAEVQVGQAKQPATQAMAVERYKAAITANPNHLATHLALARAYQAAGNNDEAAKHLQAAVDIDPKDPKRLVEVAKFLESIDKKPDALAMWERAAGAAPRDADIRYHLGHLALELGTTDKAQVALEKAVELKPKHFAALADLVELSLAAGDAKKAKKRLEQAEEAARAADEKERARMLKAKVEQAGKR